MVYSLPPNVLGDGVHDDTAGLQAALDSGASTVCLPRPPVHYLISRMLRLHSGQTLQLDRNATVRLADHAHAYMLGNADPATGNAGITVLGGIWDGNNEHQTCDYHQGIGWPAPFEPQRYLGVLMQFNRVTDLRVANLTLKDPETFGVQVANLTRFTFEDITFDYNMLRHNMDGVHLHGNCRQGRIANLKGATNDDMVALNADDGPMFELSRGPIEDIVVDGLWADNGYTAVRLLSAGSPVRRVRLANIFGSYRYNVVSFTHHNVHPGATSTFADVVIDGVFCAKPTEPLPGEVNKDEWGCHHAPLIWFAAGTQTENVQLTHLLRRERLKGAPPSVGIDKNATVGHLAIRDARLVNESEAPVNFLVNDGDIGVLRLDNAVMQAADGRTCGQLLTNRGTVGQHGINT